MGNPYTEYFTDIANAIREKFKITGGLKLSQFANKIDSSFPLIEYTNYDSMQDYIDRVLSAVADAIKSQRGNSTALYGREIPDAIRNTLSKEHIAAIAVLRVDNGQKIPFWSVVNNLPVTIRINNMDYPDVKPDQYIMFKTPKGLHVPDSLRYLFK